MEASADLSIITLVAHASAVVQIVLAILLIFSLVSWTIIFQKWFQMSRARREARNFDKRFWGGADLNKLYESATERRSSIGPQEGIFYSGMTEFLRSRASNLEARAGTFGVIDGVSRAMRARYQRELDILESGLSVLATIGSVSPYIGLFGTVWGIMHSFHSIGLSKSASLATVAPGISEALVATAIGLAVAVPATIGFNLFVGKLSNIDTLLVNFAGIFLNRVQRELNAHRKISRTSSEY